MSSETTRTSVIKKGVAQEDLTSFLTKGDTQSARTPNLSQDFSLLRPVEKERTKTFRQKKNFFGGLPGPKPEVGGFMGQFSEITTDQLDSLVNTFNNRRQMIQDRRRAPGRSQVFMTGQ